MKLKVNKRESMKNKSLLIKWIVPGIVYGKHIDSPIKLQFNKNEFIKLYKEVGSSTPITLKWDNIEEMVLIHDLQLNPVKDTLIHVDFLWIKKWEKVRANVQLSIIGVEILKKEGLEINVVMDNIDIEAIPSKLVNNINIDVSSLKDWDNITVESISLSDDVEIITDKKETIITVYTPKWSSADEEKDEVENNETENIDSVEK